MSTIELGRLIDKSDTIISYYEGGLRLPPKTTLEAIERELKTNLRTPWERVKPIWDEYLRKQKALKRAEAGEGAAELAKRLVELGEVEAVRTYLDLPDEMRASFYAFLKSLVDVPIPPGRVPSIVLKFEKKKAS